MNKTLTPMRPVAGLLLAALAVLAPPVLARTMVAPDASAPDWQVDCGSDDTCRASRTVKNTQNDQRIATLTVIFNREKAEQGLSVAVPLGVAVDAGVRLIFAGRTRDMGVKVCYPDGCLALDGLDVDEFRDLMKARAVEFRYFPFSGAQPVAFEMNVEGLGKAVLEAAPARTDLFAP